MGNEAEDSTDTTNDTFNNQAFQPRGDVDALEEALNSRWDDFAKKNIVGPVCGHATEGGNGDAIDDNHDNHENRNCQPAIGDDFVNSVGNAKVAFPLALDRTADDIVDFAIPCESECAFNVVIMAFFVFSDESLNLFTLIRRKLADKILFESTERPITNLAFGVGFSNDFTDL